MKGVKYMISFERVDLREKEKYDAYLKHCDGRGCEYSFVNLFLWGRQKTAFLRDHLVLFSQFNRRTVYPFPIGPGDKREILDTVMEDAHQRGIPCYISSLTREDCDLLESLYPGRFRFHLDRDSFDYIYSIEDLAELKGRKFQKKRNFVNRFQEEHPNAQILPLDEKTRAAAYCMLQKWYEDRLKMDPTRDFHLERIAMDRAFAFQNQLGLEGIVMVDGGEILAFTMGSFLSDDTFDVHFEKAREDIQGAYNAINRAFARHLRDKYPQLKWLNREDDMGLEGLRKAKLSYNPDHLCEKYWAKLWEEEEDEI